MTAHPGRRDGLGMSDSAGLNCYEIVVRGRLTRRFALSAGGVSVEPRCGQTVLRTGAADMAAVNDLLDRIQAFGLELVSVNAVD